MDLAKLKTDLSPYQQRVVDEKAELDARLAGLTAFLPTNLCLGLSFEERGRLSQQHRVMGLYSTVLGERIEAWASPERTQQREEVIQ